jgi:hypothetical protein
MSRARRSWREKLADDKGLPRVVAIDAGKSTRWGEGTCAIPAPRDIDALMRQVRRGRLTTIDDMRTAVARKHGATIGCPITTGIFAWIAAHAAAEDEADGRTCVTPYWRTLKRGGELNPKYPGGLDDVQQRLEKEGHTVVRRRKRAFVVDFDKHLTKHDPHT